MNSKHPQDIHGHLQRAKVCFFYNPNISEYVRILPNQNFFSFRISGKPWPWVCVLGYAKEMVGFVERSGALFSVV